MHKNNLDLQNKTYKKRKENENTDKEARLGWAGCCEATFAEKIFCLPGTQSALGAWVLEWKSQ